MYHQLRTSHWTGSRKQPFLRTACGTMTTGSMQCEIIVCRDFRKLPMQTHHPRRQRSRPLLSCANHLQALGWRDRAWQSREARTRSGSRWPTCPAKIAFVERQRPADPTPYSADDPIWRGLVRIPLVTTALSPFLLNEKVGFRRWTAVLVGFFGILVVIRPGIIEINLASIAAVGTGCFYGFYLIITRKLHSTDSPLLTLLITGVVGAIIASFFVPIVWINPTPIQWSWMALMGIFACLGHILIILSLRYADASKLAPFGYFEIITNLILGYYVFADFPDKYTFIGLFIIVSSGLYVFKREYYHKYK